LIYNISLLFKKSFVRIILLGFLIILSCGDSVSSLIDDKKTFHYDSLAVDEIYNLITGKWDWLYSRIMQRDLDSPDNLIIPDSIGYTMLLDFHTTKQLDYYKNDTLFVTSSFEIMRFKVLPTDSGEVTIIRIDSSSFQLHFSHPDSMMIGNGWLDGIDDFYSRIK